MEQSPMATVTTLPDNLTTDEVIDAIFKDPTVKHGLSEFSDLGKKPSELLEIYPRLILSGRSRGEVRYFLKCFKRGIDVQVYSERKSSPEEIVRQLWLYKLHSNYGYPWDQIEVEYQQ
jgi:type I restriction enzyme M protein